MNSEVTIPARFNGPPTSGNGGYSCGVLAAFVDGPARVRLHVPPPMDRAMRVSPVEGGYEMYDGDTLVGTGGPVELVLEVPASPGLERAQDAMQRYLCQRDHMFPTCFVCGPERPDHDGLELYPGPVDDWNLLACTWQPAPDLLDAEGNVRPEVIWSALDCPGYFAAVGDTLRPAVLGQLEGEIHASVPGDAPLVVYAWPLGGEGRKIYGGTAIADAAGKVLARSHSTWIELKA